MTDCHATAAALVSNSAFVGFFVRGLRVCRLTVCRGGMPLWGDIGRDRELNVDDRPMRRAEVRRNSTEAIASAYATITFVAN